MVRRLKDGRFIFSAGEVGEYTVCPEAWRLKFVERVSAEEREEARTGAVLHEEWAREYEEARYLSRGTRTVLFLIGIVIITFILSLSR